MSRLLHIGDLHIGASAWDSEGISWGDVAASLITEAANCDAVVITGDLFDGVPSADDRRRAYELLFNLSSTPIAVVRGNHDPHGEIALLGYLPNVTPHETPGVISMPGGIAIVTLPWPEVWRTGVELAPGEQRAHAVEQARRGLMALMRQRVTEAAMEHEHVVLAAHIMVHGATLGGRALIEGAFPITASELAETGADYIALGHVHEMQCLGDGIWYAGCPAPLTWGDTARPHLGIKVVFGDAAPDILPIPSPAPVRVTIVVEPAGEGGLFTFMAGRGAPHSGHKTLLRIILKDIPPEREAMAIERATKAVTSYSELAADPFIQRVRTPPEIRRRDTAVGEHMSDEQLLRAWLTENVEDEQRRGKCLTAAEEEGLA